MSRRTRWIALAAMLLVTSAGGAWMAWPQPEPDESATDTGMDDEAQRELLQEIGYLK